MLSFIVITCLASLGRGDRFLVPIKALTIYRDKQPGLLAPRQAFAIENLATKEVNYFISLHGIVPI